MPFPALTTLIPTMVSSGIIATIVDVVTQKAERTLRARSCPLCDGCIRPGAPPHSHGKAHHAGQGQAGQAPSAALWGEEYKANTTHADARKFQSKYTQSSNAKGTSLGSSDQTNGAKMTDGDRSAPDTDATGLAEGGENSQYRGSTYAGDEDEVCDVHANDWFRSIRYGVTHSIWNVPLKFCRIALLNMMVPGAPGAAVGLQKMLINEVLFSPVETVGMLGTMDALQHRSLYSAWHKVRQDAMPVQVSKWTVHPLQQFITFAYLKEMHHIIYFNLATKLVCEVVICYYASRGPGDKGISSLCLSKTTKEGPHHTGPVLRPGDEVGGGMTRHAMHGPNTSPTIDRVSVGVSCSASEIDAKLREYEEEDGEEIYVRKPTLKEIPINVVAHVVQQRVDGVYTEIPLDDGIKSSPSERSEEGDGTQAI